MSFLIPKDKRTARHIVFMLMGFSLIYYGGWVYFVVPTLVDQYRSYYWNTLQGNVVESEIIKKRSKSSKPYSIKIKYEFKTINGTIEHSNRVFAGQDSTQSIGKFKTMEEAQELLIQYSVGNEITVYINPHDNHDVCLFPGFTLPPIIFFVMSCIYICLGLMVLYLVYYFRYRNIVVKGKM